MGDALKHEHGLEDGAARRQAVVHQESGIAGLAGGQHFLRRQQQRMIGAQVEQIVAGEGSGAVERCRARSCLELFEAFRCQVFGIEQPQLRTQRLAMDAEGLQQAQRVVVVALVEVVVLQ